MSSPLATELLAVSLKCLFFINMIWVFKEHLVSSESMNYTRMGVTGGHTYPGLGV